MINTEYSKDLISATQVLTDAYANLGPVLPVSNREGIALFLGLDINDGSGVTVKAVSKTSPTDTDEYELVNGTTYSSEATLPNADAKFMLLFETSACTPYIQFKVKATTPGTDPNIAAITKAVVTSEIKN